MESIAKHLEYVGNLLTRDHTCHASDYSHRCKGFLQSFIGVVDKDPAEKGIGAPTQNARTVRHSYLAEPHGLLEAGYLHHYGQDSTGLALGGTV